jgi:hypothetical protein
MSIFEDLIEELKDENLIEETVIEFHREKNQASAPQPEVHPADNFQAGKIPDFEASQPTVQAFANGSADIFGEPDLSVDEDIYSADLLVGNEPTINLENADVLIPEAAAVVFAEEQKTYKEVEKPKIYVSEKEYFRKRAMDEVTGLQMVDHVLGGIEREQMKLAPKPYDDLPVKLALHDFLQDGHDANTTEHAQSEFRLMQETENWYSALSHRDKQITVAHLRRYCETTRPALSSQALIALARFYRNSPYTESVRSKFELVLTRLFSHEIEFEKRELLLNHAEMIQQIKELYADWSSIQLYSANEEDSDILISTMKFDDFVAEAESTTKFDDLISKDFFNRLRMFKEGCNENFFAPSVAVAAITANIKIGNRYIDLLTKEKEKFNADTLEEKYGFLHDQVISDSTGKTFQLVALLNDQTEAKREPSEIHEISVKEAQKTTKKQVAKAPRNKLFAVNKWLLGTTILTIAICVGLYFWAEYETQSIKPSPGVKKVNLENSEFKDYIQTARISGETFFGITTPSWENMNSEKKQEMLKKLLSIGSEKKYTKVHLINSGGKSVGFASGEKAEIYNQ